METFFKKYLGFVLLGLLAVSGTLFAAGATRLFASVLLVPKPVPLVVEKAPEVKVTRDNRGGAILERNIFDSTASAQPVSEEEPEQEQPQEDLAALGTDVELGDNVPISDLPVTVTGTIVSSVPKSSNTAIRDGAEVLLYQEGDTLKETSTIFAIRRSNVFILRNGRLERLPLLSDEARAASGPAAGRPGSPYSSPMGAGGGPAMASASPAAGGKDPAAAAREGIKKTGPEEYEIDRAMLDEQLQDLNKLSSQARVIPHYKDGRADGFKLVGVRPGSLYSYIGVRSGDVIRRVNGEELNNPSKALSLFEKLRTQSNIVVDVERRGTNVSLTYNIK